MPRGQGDASVPNEPHPDRGRRGNTTQTVGCIAMSVGLKPEHTVEEYLNFERNSAFRHELIHGEIREMTGGTVAHALLIANLHLLMAAQLRKPGFWIFMTVMRVKVNQSGLYTYPDLAVVKGKPELEDDVNDTLLNPIVLIEVLSSSTQKFDRFEKFSLYKGIPSFQEYILVAQDQAKIDQFVRNDTGTWTHTTYEGAAASLKFKLVPCTIPLTDIYDQIQFVSNAE